MTTPWAPDEVEPQDDLPPLADTVPVVVSTWHPVPGGAARPWLYGLSGQAVSLKRDHSVDRVRRFAEAWAWLRRQPGPPADDGRVDWLVGAGVLVPRKVPT